MQFLLNTCFWCPFLDPHLTTYHENIGVQTIAFGRNRHIYHVHFTDFALQLLIMSVKFMSQQLFTDVAVE